ncbi:MAG: RagB/SusD family nutrient uptake outer membrane protein [Prevotella sp.]|jgi:hypothetical protein
MKLSKIIFLLIASLALTSCLDENPKGQVDEDEAYSTASNLYINSVALLYNYIGGNSDSQGLQGTYRGVYDYNTFTTDEAIIPTRGGDWYDGGFWQNLYLHKWTADDDALYDTWSYLFKVVVLCNRSLSIIDEHQDLLTSTQLSQYKAEVRAVRALFYYELLDMFARVPIDTLYSTPLADVKPAQRSEVFSFVVNELQEVAPLLPNERSNQQGNYYGRITRPVAWFLLARLALNAEVYSDDDWTDGSRPSGSDIYFTVDGQQLNAWETCEAYVDKLTQFGFTLASDYSSNFAVQNETSEENIFTIPMDKQLYTNIFKNLFRSRHYNHGSAIGMDAENGSCATLSTVKAYGYDTDSVDSRWAINFFADTLRVDGSIVYLDNGEPLIYRPWAVAVDLTGNEYEKTGGARMWKYEIDRTAYSDGQLQNNDIVLFRYADALLMKAEAKVRNGEDGSTELNQVRARVGMPARQATLANILEERLLELMWEGCRRPDLIRYGLFNQAYDIRPQVTDEDNGFTTVFPIPSKAISLNSNLQQNPGYSNKGE